MVRPVDPQRSEHIFRYYRVTRPPGRAVLPISDDHPIELPPPYGFLYPPEEPVVFVFEKANKFYLIPLQEHEAKYLRLQGYSVSDTKQPPEKEQWLLTLGERVAALELAKSNLWSSYDPSTLSPWELCLVIQKYKPLANAFSRLDEIDLALLSPPAATEEEMQAIQITISVGRRLEDRIIELKKILDGQMNERKLVLDGDTLKLLANQRGPRKLYVTKVIEDLFKFLEAKNGLPLKNTRKVQGDVQRMLEQLFGLKVATNTIKRAIERLLKNQGGSPPVQSE
jgi:hypothetical protein